MDPPKIRCPSLKDKWAEPGKLTARVTWDTPEGVDTADGILTESVSPPPPFWSWLASDSSQGESLPGIKADLISFSVVLKGKPSKSNFPEGLHKLSYTVFDRAGNKGSCRFTVRVRGELLIHVWEMVKCQRSNVFKRVCRESTFYYKTFGASIRQRIDAKNAHILFSIQPTLCVKRFKTAQLTKVLHTIDKRHINKHSIFTWCDLHTDVRKK